MNLKKVLFITLIFGLHTSNAIKKRKFEQTCTPKHGLVIRTIENRTNWPISMYLSRDEANPAVTEEIIVQPGRHTYDLSTLLLASPTHFITFNYDPAQEENVEFGLRMNAARLLLNSVIPGKRLIAVMVGLHTFDFMPTLINTGIVDQVPSGDLLSASESDYYAVDLILAGDHFELSKIAKIAPRIVEE
ncbi:hypothetical protein BH09DEP1_BH09DEP1_5820 [soil metagenome]